MRPSDPFFSDRFVGPYPTSGSRKGQAANAVNDMLFNTELIKSTVDSGIKAGGGTNEHRRQASNEDLDVIRLANQINGGGLQSKKKLTKSKKSASQGHKRPKTAANHNVSYAQSQKNMLQTKANMKKIFLNYCDFNKQTGTPFISQTTC